MSRVRSDVTALWSRASGDSKRLSGERLTGRYTPLSLISARCQRHTPGFRRRNIPLQEVGCAKRTAQLVLGGFLDLERLRAAVVGRLPVGLGIIDHAHTRSATEGIADRHGARDNR